jgi:hypothetical protein
MEYEYTVRIDETVRLRAITERTFKAATAEKRPMNDQEVMLLQYLDHAAISRLCGAYFLAVDDRPWEPGPFYLGGPAASHHARICSMLSTIGTQEIAPGLLQALEKRRFLRPSAETTPLDWPWIAALAIATRDPWPEVDAWLAGLMGRNDLLYLEDADRDRPAEMVDGEPALPRRPDLGATAAGLLLERHQVPPSLYGLRLVSLPILEETGCRLYQFESPEARAKIERWWSQHDRPVPGGAEAP